MKLIVNADDFGCSHEVNQAVMQAHRQGILTSASLMVGGAAFDEALRLAWQTPTLSVGLHVAVADAPAVLPLSRIPHLLDDNGLLPRNPVWLGIHSAINVRVRAELAAEVEAQFARFAATGLPLAHVDGHLHMHLHPTVFRIMLPLMRRYDARGFRLVRIPPVSICKRYPRDAISKIVPAIALSILSRRCMRLLRGSGIAVTSQTYGFFRSGHMDVSHVLDLLGHVDDASAEIYFHPTIGNRIDPLGPNQGDLQSLLSAAVRQLVARKHVKLCGYPDLFLSSHQPKVVSA